MFHRSKRYFGCAIYNIGTPAAKMKKVQSKIVKQRSRELTSVFEAFAPYTGMECREERIWITEVATDGIHLVSPYFISNKTESYYIFFYIFDCQHCFIYKLNL